MRGLATFFVVVCALCALAGAIVTAVHGGWSYAHGIAWALWIGGCLLVLVVGSSGSTTQMAGQARAFPGFVWMWGSDRALPQSPWAFIPVGVLMIGVGVLLYVL